MLTIPETFFIITISDTNVAKVEATGKLTAITPGKATITCTAQDGSGSTDKCDVIVTETITETIKVTSLTLNAHTITWKKGHTGTFKATLLPSNATNTAVKWTSSDTDVATVVDGAKLTSLELNTNELT